jgi:hypothetical protein
MKSSRTICSALGAILMLLALGWSRPAAAGPWVNQPGEAYLKLSGGYFAANGVYDLEGNLDEDPRYEYSHWDVRLYSDIGIVPHLSFGFSVPFRQATNRVDTTDYIKTGPGDLDLFVKSGASFGTCAAAGRAGVQIPLYSEGVGSDPNDGPVSSGSTGRERFMPVLGDGNVNMSLLASFGCSLHPFPGWFDVAAGPQFRFDGFGDGLEYAGSFGAYVWPERLALKARVGGIQNLAANPSMPTKSYVQVSGGAIIDVVDRVAIEATAAWIPWGEFVTRGWSASLGVSYSGPLWSNPFEEE